MEISQTFCRMHSQNAVSQAWAVTDALDVAVAVRVAVSEGVREKVAVGDGLAECVMVAVGVSEVVAEPVAVDEPVVESATRQRLPPAVPRAGGVGAGILALCSEESPPW